MIWRQANFSDEYFFFIFNIEETAKKPASGLFFRNVGISLKFMALKPRRP
jgi:hypothetical protein